MIPLQDACFRVEGRDIVPAYLRDTDHPWLRALLDEHARFVGQRRAELSRRLEEPLSVKAPRGKLRMAARVLQRATATRVKSPHAPAAARRQVYERAAALARAGGDRRDAIGEVAAALSLAPADLAESLTADLPSQRRIVAHEPPLDPAELASSVNVALVASLLRRARHLDVQVWGGARDVVRHAQHLGLIAVAAPMPDTLDVLDGARLDISGPAALFRRTTIYTRALTSLVMRLAWCARAHADADCEIEGVEHRLRIHHDDPLRVGREPLRFDSQVEARFARELAREAPNWDVVREPAPIEVGGRLVFPDFALVHRRDPRRRFLLEIVGFWTTEYLTQKLAALRAVAGSRFIVCANEKLGVGREHHLPGSRVLTYRRWVDAGEVARMVEGNAAICSSSY